MTKQIHLPDARRGHIVPLNEDAPAHLDPAKVIDPACARRGHIVEVVPEADEEETDHGC